MQITINTDNHISNSNEFSAELTAKLEDKLEKFSSHITTLKLYLSDENSEKSGTHDKKCLIEARIEGMNPTAVTHNAGTLLDAFHGATQKIERVIKSSLEQRRQY